MIHRTPLTAAILLSLSALSVAGCTSQEAFPSLAPRPIEAIARQPERSATPLVGSVDPALDARVAAIAAKLAAEAADWNTALAATRGAVDRARGRTIGDDSWVLAQQALSRLESIRQATGALIEDLDALRRQQAESSRPADMTQLDRAWTRGTAQAESQNAAFRAVASLLPAG